MEARINTQGRNTIVTTVGQPRHTITAHCRNSADNMWFVSFVQNDYCRYTIRRINAPILAVSNSDKCQGFKYFRTPEDIYYMSIIIFIISISLCVFCVQELTQFCTSTVLLVLFVVQQLNQTRHPIYMDGFYWSTIHNPTRTRNQRVIDRFVVEWYTPSCSR